VDHIMWVRKTQHKLAKTQVSRECERMCACVCARVCVRVCVCEIIVIALSLRHVLECFFNRDV